MARIRGVGTYRKGWQYCLLPALRKQRAVIKRCIDTNNAANICCFSGK